MLGQTTKRISATYLAQYVRLRNCDRYLWFQLYPEKERSLRRKWEVTNQPLTPLLQETGLAFEAEVAAALGNRGEPVINLSADETTASTRYWLSNVREPVILLQARLEAPVGRFLCNGVADVIRLYRDADSRLQAYIADIKSSRRERMEHRLQIAAYAFMLKEMCGDEGEAVSQIYGGVLHQQADGSIPTLDPDQPTFDLAPYLTTLEQLLLNDDSIVNRVAEQGLLDTRYHLGYWCDGCYFNATCMYDSAERLDLALVPGITPVEKRVLQEAGIETVPQLANLMQLPAANGNRALTPSPGQEGVIHQLEGQWPIGPNLPVLVQRARRAARQFDRTVQSAPFLFGAEWGTLPDDSACPDLVKVFFDAQHDYLADRVYLLSALVKGPRGAKTIVEYTPGVPTAQAERQLLLDWVQGILLAVMDVATGLETPIHLYCYNSYDQRTLLDALKRHLEQVALLPGFFDLATQHPAVSQSMISFLAKELETRQNLGLTCMPLHDAARSLGFDWQDGDHEYFKIFRARMFDNRRDVVRRWNGDLKQAPPEVPRSDPNRFTIESASRFNSQVPLEYAYAAWGRLPDIPEGRELLKPFQGVSWKQLKGFARRRAEALEHIEKSFKYKSKYIDKLALDLTALRNGSAPRPALAQSLREFLFMEHYAALQAKLQVYSLPVERRMQTGLALLLRFERKEHLRGTYRFSTPFAELELEPASAMNNFRLKEGAWVVLNEAESKWATGSGVKHGRLGVIREIGDGWVELDLLDISFGRGSRFRYYHKRDLEPDVGKRYTLDEMADDMNGDKALAALNNAPTNVFYQWLVRRPSPRSLPENVCLLAAEALATIEQLVAPYSLTAVQKEILGGQFEEPLFLVQGPPGTGKSYTLGWAAVVRLLAWHALQRPLRIAVASKTHNAVNIVLASIAQKWARLQTSGQAPAIGLLGLPVYKLVNDADEPTPERVQSLHAYSHKSQELEQMLAQPYLVLGGTPGGLYSFAKEREAGGKTVDWSVKTFDLLIMDEASQMSLPEAVLAGAFLKPDGQIIVVGDHRQMPPIIAHNWDEEELRSAVTAQPHLSLFESLLQRGFPRLSLDESFRLHHTIADFLQQNIYVHDGILFHSRRTAIIDKTSKTDAYVNAVLDPLYPIVVVEHAEVGSQQYNETELALLEPLLRPCTEQLGLNGSDGLGIVVPHRAQRAMLQARFPQLADSIDTVERFQGGERDVIIVSATASDPDFVLAEADFLLNLNRLNVALSRPRKKLIVIASRSVTNLLVSELETFENAVIWKRLYYQYANQLLWKGERGGVAVQVCGHPARNNEARG